MTFPALFRRLPRSAVVAWVALLVGVIGRVAWAGPNSGTVMPIYLTAGVRWLSGGDVYAPAWPLDVFRNPPGVAAFFTPWALLPPKAAGVLWRVLSVAVYLTGLWAWVRRLPLAGVSDRQLGQFAVLAAVLIIPSFNNGQVNVLLVGCLLHAAAAFRRDRPTTAAGWVAVAGFFKLYPLALGLLFCVIAPRFAVRLAAAAALAFALPFACQELDYVERMHAGFVGFIGRDCAFRTTLHRSPWDWTIVPRVWLDVSASKELTQAVAAAAGLGFAAVVLLARWRRPPADAIAPAFVLGCVWMTLFGPATENATYTLLAPAAALLTLRERWYRRPAAVAAVGLLMMPILRGLFSSSEVLPLRTAQPFAAVLIGGIAVADVVRVRRRAVTDSVQPPVVTYTGRPALPAPG